MSEDGLHIPTKNYELLPTEGSPIQFSGRKLLECSSLDHPHRTENDRWYTLTLYIGDDHHFYFTIEYCSRTMGHYEQEEGYFHVVRSNSYVNIADAVANYDFMKPVVLDYSGGGHIAVMNYAAEAHFRLVVTFHVTATRFLEDVFELRQKSRIGDGLPRR